MVMGAMVKRLSVLALACSLAGCSLLLDNGQFVGDGDSGARPRDAGPDAMQPPDAGPDAPSTPVVSIGPDPARTLDDLVASIDTESTDPLDRGAIRYEYRWLVDGADASNESATVSNDATAKDQTWRVEVTPVTIDDRRGVPGSAEVVIQNTAPTLQTVGLSSYRPVSGDILFAMPGQTRDADGDTVNIRYRWLVDDVPASATGSRLPLLDTIPVGAAVRVEATASDGTDESDPQDAGDAVVVENTLRWIQHWPDRGSVTFITHDPRHERVLFGVGTTSSPRQDLWEHDLLEDRFVRLRATGPQFQPDVPQKGLFDPVGERIFFMDASGTSGASLFELDVADRGRESWREVTLEGEVPALFALGAVFDEARNRIIVSAPDESGTATDLYEIDVSGAVGMTRRVASAQPAALGFGSWVRVPGTEEVYVLGGGESFMTMSPSDLVHRLRLDAIESGAVETSVRLPRAAAALAAAITPDGSRIFFGGGVNASGSVSGFWTLDLATMSVVERALADPRIDGKFLGYLLNDTRAERWLYFPGKDGLFSPAEYQLFGVPFAADSLDDVHAHGTQVLGPLHGSMGIVTEENLRVFGGVDRTDTPRGETWTANIAGGRPFDGFERLAVVPDGAEGLPAPRAFVDVVATPFEFTPLLAFFGGADGPTGFVDTTTWRLDGAQWIARTLRPGATAPAPRSGAAFFEGCGGDLTVFGGLTPGGATNDVSTMQCASLDTDCEWTSLSPAGTPPTARAGTAILLETSGAAIIIGGAGGSSIDAHRLETCTPSWETLTAAGDVPTARAGHTIANGSPSYLFGGSSGSTYFADLYSVGVSGSTVSFTGLTPSPDDDAVPEGRANHIALLSNDSTAPNARLFIIGGWRGRLGFGGGPRILGDVWELRIPR